MLLKFFQVEYSFIITQKPNKKVFVLNGKNNYKYIYRQVVKKDYIYIFTSFKIAFLKKFKKNILDNSKFMDWLHILAIDKTYLINPWSQDYWFL